MLADYLVPCKYRAVYMAVTNDKYELPIAAADGMREIAGRRSCLRFSARAWDGQGQI